jgi:hypothetical protein
MRSRGVVLRSTRRSTTDAPGLGKTSDQASGALSMTATRPARLSEGKGGQRLDQERFIGSAHTRHFESLPFNRQGMSTCDLH